MGKPNALKSTIDLMRGPKKGEETMVLDELNALSDLMEKNKGKDALASIHRIGTAEETQRDEMTFQVAIGSIIYALRQKGAENLDDVILENPAEALDHLVRVHDVSFNTTQQAAFIKLQQGRYATQLDLSPEQRRVAEKIAAKTEGGDFWNSILRESQGDFGERFDLLEKENPKLARNLKISAAVVGTGLVLGLGFIALKKWRVLDQKLGVSETVKGIKVRHVAMAGGALAFGAWISSKDWSWDKFKDWMLKTLGKKGALDAMTEVKNDIENFPENVRGTIEQGYDEMNQLFNESEAGKVANKRTEKTKEAIDSAGEVVDKGKVKVAAIEKLFTSVAFFEPEYAGTNIRNNINKVVLSIVNTEGLTLEKMEQLVESYSKKEAIPAKALGWKEIPEVNPDSRMTNEQYLFVILNRFTYFCKLASLEKTSTPRECVSKIISNPVYEMNHEFHEKIMNGLQPGNILETITNLDYEELDAAAASKSEAFIEAMDGWVFNNLEDKKLFDELSKPENAQEKMALRGLQAYLMANKNLNDNPEISVDEGIAETWVEGGKDKYPNARKLAIVFFERIQSNTVNVLLPRVHERFSLIEIYNEDHIRDGLNERIAFRHAVELNLASEGIDWGSKESSHWMKDLALLQVVLRAMDGHNRREYLAHLLRAFTESDVLDYTIPGLQGLEPYLQNLEDLIGKMGFGWMVKLLEPTEALEYLPSESDNFYERLKKQPGWTLWYETVGGFLEMPKDSLAMLVVTLNRVGVPLEKIMGMKTYDDFIEIILNKNLSKDVTVVYDPDKPGKLVIQVGYRYFLAKPAGIFAQSLEQMWKGDGALDRFGGAAAIWLAGSSPLIVIGAGWEGYRTVGRGPTRGGAIKRNLRVTMAEMALGGARMARYPLTPFYTARQGAKVIRWGAIKAKNTWEIIKTPKKKLDAIIYWIDAVKKHKILFPGADPRNLVRDMSRMENSLARVLNFPTRREAFRDLSKAAIKVIFSPRDSWREFRADRKTFLQKIFLESSEAARARIAAGMKGRIGQEFLMDDLRNVGEGLFSFLEYRKGEAPFDLLKGELDLQTRKLITEGADQISGFLNTLNADPSYYKKIKDASKITDKAARVTELEALFRAGGLDKINAGCLARQSGHDAAFLLKKIDDARDQFVETFILTGKKTKRTSPKKGPKKPGPKRPKKPKAGPIAPEAEFIRSEKELRQLKEGINSKIAQAEAEMAKLRKEAVTEASMERMGELLKYRSTLQDYMDAVESNYKQTELLTSADKKTGELIAKLEKKREALKIAGNTAEAKKLDEIIGVYTSHRKEIQATLREAERVTLMLKTIDIKKIKLLDMVRMDAQVLEMMARSTAAHGKNGAKIQRTINRAKGLKKSLQGSKVALQTAGKVLGPALLVFDVYMVGEAFGRAIESKKRGSSEVAKQEMREGLLYGAEGLSYFAGPYGIVVLPITYTMNEMVQRQKEVIDMTSADWIMSYKYPELIHEFYSTVGANSFGDRFKVIFESMGKKTREQSKRGTVEDNIIVMHRMYRSLVATTATTDVIQALNKEGVQTREVNQAIAKGYNKYHEYFFWNIDLSKMTSYSDAHTQMALAAKFNQIMQQRDYEKSTGAESWMIGGVDLLDDKYEVRGNAKQAFSMSNFDPQEVIRAWDKKQESALSIENMGGVRENLKTVRTNYLLYLYAQINILTHDKESFQWLNLSEADKHKAFYYMELINNELSLHRSSIVQVEAGNPSFFKYPLRADQIMGHLNDLEKEVPKSYLGYESAHNTGNASVQALYKAAELFGYRGDVTEEAMKKFFKEDHVGRHGIYWSGRDWYTQEAGLELDNKMGHSLERDTVSNMIEFLRENKDDILMHRNTDTFGIIEAGQFEGQVDKLADTLEKGYREGKKRDKERQKASAAVDPNLEGRDLTNRYAQVIRAAKDTSGLHNLRFKVEDENTIRISQWNTDGERTLHKKGNSWEIENYNHKPLNLAQAAAMAHLINRTWNAITQRDKYGKGAKPFQIDGGKIEMRTKAFTKDMMIISNTGFRSFEKLGMSKKQVIEVLNAWYGHSSGLNFAELAESLYSKAA